ncbi:GNAT family N-acetyltransferase [Williamsia sp. SKLECPSW1]
MARRGRPPAIGRDEVLAAALAVLRERGVARLTTREIAARAQVSEGSIFYHFTDRRGLLAAVFDEALQPLFAFKNDLDAGAATSLHDVRHVLEQYVEAMRTFLDDGLEVLVAAHGDAQVRDDVGAVVTANDFGPHRGVAAMTRYFDDLRESGVVAEGVDTRTPAYLMVSATFLRSAQPKLFGHDTGIPPMGDVIDAVVSLLGSASSRDVVAPSASAPIHVADESAAPELVVLQRCCWVQEAVANDTLDIPPLHETVDDVRRWFTDWTVLTVRDGPRLVGAVRGRLVGDTWEIGRLMVAPDAAGRGLGRRLLAEAERVAPLEARTLELFTGAGSDRNLAIYRRAGYRVVDDDEAPTGVVVLRRSRGDVPESADR